MVKRIWLMFLTIWLTCVFVGMDAHALSGATHETEHSHIAAAPEHQHIDASSSDGNASSGDSTEDCDQRHCGHCHAIGALIKQDGRVAIVGSTQIFNTLLGHRGTPISADIERPKWFFTTPVVVSRLS